VSGGVPSEWRGRGRVELSIDLGFSEAKPGFQCEGLVRLPDGTAVKGLEPRNHHVPLSAAPGEEFEFFVEAASNPDLTRGDDFRSPLAFSATPLGDRATAGTDPLYRYGSIEVRLVDEEVERLLREVRILSGLARELAPTDPRRAAILRGLSEALHAIDPDRIDAAAARERLAPLLASPAAATTLALTATGHAHIDSAWLWPVRETIRKCARTFSNAVTLMDQEEDFTFSVSSAQQYAWIKERYPELFERIREKVAEGRFVPVGGMWVESDTNMPGSEAMARQFVAGKRFFLENFDVETTQTWLPDSFGYSAALPQIASLAGQPNFLTQKVSWNQINTFPHHTFHWEGLDGTSVFTHFPPADTYNGMLDQKELAYFEKNFKDKGKASLGMDLFGWGDGGGGPTREMLAAGRRAADLEGSTRVEFGSPEEFFDRARAEYPDAPVWNGELYLELHRGTYSAQLGTKQGNRRSEHVLHEAEFLASLAAVRAGAAYPYDELEELWHDALLLQFHDILPGSAIAWVHRDAERNHQAIHERAEAIVQRSLAALGGDEGADGAETVLLNTAPVAREGVEPYAAAAPLQRGEGVSVIREGDLVRLDNGLVRAVIDARGEIISLVNRADSREAIAPGTSGARLQLHRDTPNAWDAWDIDEFYRHVVRDLDAPGAAEVADEDGGARVSFTYSTTVPASRPTEGVTGAGSAIVKTFVLNPGDESLGIELDLDWHERKKALKLGFGLDLRAPVLKSEIQFGHVQRPIPVNTSWDFARFETCAHRWVQASEGDYGVAIANDSTYGHDVLRSVREQDGGTTTTVRLTLVRSPEYPDPHADQGRYTVRVRIAPGAGVERAVEEGYRLNLPARRVAGAVAQAAGTPLVRVQGAPSVLVETVKLAEDRSGDLVLRLYESQGKRARAALELDPALVGRDAQVVDLLEREFGAEAPAHLTAADRDEQGEQAPVLTFRPFEIKTLRVRRA
jgi:alpha-mannosidase